MALIRIHEKPNAIPVNASVFAIETQISGVWYSQKVTWEQLVGLVSALDSLQNYYTKSETYTKQEVQALIAQIPSFTVEVVQQLPTEDISTTTLYLVPKSTPEAQDYYEEYINLDGTTSGWEYVGTTQVDLSNYYTKAETEAYVKGDGADYIAGTKTFSALTTTAKSILGAINEVAGVASSAQADATQALADASTAQGTANSASAAASAAQTTADAAATAAGNAASAASAAQTTANAAQTAAAAAQTTADAAAAGLLLKEDKTAMPEDVADIIKQMKTPKTVNGNPVTFETVEETFAKGAELTFGPIQDLHGYDSPWPAGAGKNMFHVIAGTGYTDTENGISIGTSYASYATLFSGKLEVGTYTISNSAGGASNTTYQLAVRKNGTTTGYALNDPVNLIVDSPDDTYEVRLYVYANNTTNPVKPQLEKGSAATSYAPYENNCPISGRNSVSLTVGGKNLFGQELEQGTLSETKPAGTPYDQMKNSITSRCRTVVPFAIPEYPVTISIKSGFKFFQVYLDENDLYLGSFWNWSQSCTITDTSLKKVGIVIRKDDSSAITPSECENLLQIEACSTATAYEPYVAPRTTTQSFSSTEYGAKGSIKDGDWKRTTKLATFDGSENWTYSSSGGGRYQIVSVGLPANSQVACNILKAVNEQATGNVYISNSGNLLCYVADASAENLTAWTNYLSNTNMELAYELATPEAITGTAQDILLNAGTNVVSTDADTAAVTYTEMTTLDDMRTLINAAQTT